MSIDPPSDEPRDAGQEALERDISEAMTSLGWKVPQCEDEVQRAETELKGDLAALPEELQDPKAAFNRSVGQVRARPQVLQFFGDAEIERDLARAARDGGPIPPEIEEIMRRDREAAEREFKNAEQKDPEAE